MKVKFFILWMFFALYYLNANSQDTFSIVALDSITGEVGSAGASCVNMSSFPGLSTDFLGELFPGIGAINTQAYYISANQVNARNRMNMGDTPAQLINWLTNNDVTNQPYLRQYGIVAFVNASPETAAHTGADTDDYKNHILGPNYSIQGNILLGQHILDSMESKFLNTQGNLACKLMAALQGAKTVGADTRCASNGTSSLFAFVKVAQTGDSFGNPSFLLSVETFTGSAIEPIDSLQTIFDNVLNCTNVGIDYNESFNSHFLIYPNPVGPTIVINQKIKDSTIFDLEIVDGLGKVIYESMFQESSEIDVSAFIKGIYFIRISNAGNTYITKMIKN